MTPVAKNPTVSTPTPTPSPEPRPPARRLRGRAILFVAGLLAVPLLGGTSAQSARAGVVVTTESPAPRTEAARRADPLAPCRMKPRNGNTGARGDLRDDDRTVLGDGARLSNARVSNLTISGTDVKVTNVSVDGDILVTGEKVRLKRVTAKHIAISSAVDVLVAKANIGYSTDDAIHITSDGDRLVRRVVLRYNYIHHPRAPSDSHYDGTQVRGVDDLVIRCSTYRSGPFQDTFNANIYLENVQGGVTRATVARNWLYGSAWSVMVSAESARFIGNRFGGDIHWGYCYLGSGSGGFESRNNVSVPKGRKINLCGQG